MTAVIVPVYNGAHVLQDTVPALLALTGVEAWVWVDDGSTDATPELLREITATVESATVVTLPENRGRAAARNAGVRATDADRLIFMDADVAPEADFAARTIAALETSGAVASVGAFVSEPPNPDEPYAVYLRRVSRGVSAPACTPVAWKHFLAGAVGMSREAFDAVGGFDETIPYGEDLELAARLSRDHPEGLVSSGTSVRVADVDDLDGALCRIRTFGRALPAMVDRTPEVLEISRLEALFAPTILRAIARSIPLARRVRAALTWLPERGVVLAVRYLLAHALARAIADAPSHAR